MSLSLSVDGPGDAELISAVRGGDVDAYGELFARHVDAARRLARQLAGPADADDLVSDAFTKVLTVLQRGGGPDLAFRAYLLTAVRRLHVDKIRASSRLRPVDDLTPFDPGLPFQDTAVEGFDNAAAARAFASLPERWQMVLWHTEVEQQKPADIAPLLGMSANSVSALAYRAREGLRQAFLSQHATDPDDVDCGWTRDHLGAYVRGGLSRRDAKRVDDHLEECRACAAVYLELTEVNSGLAGLIAPLLLGAAGAKYASSIGGGAAAGGAGTSGFAAAQAWAAAHVGLTAIGGLAVTATALIAVYGATHLKGHEAADVGSGTVGDVPSATTGLSPDGTSPGSTSSRGATSNGTASPGTSASSAGADSVGPSADASASADASITPSTDPASGATVSTTGPTDPSTAPSTGPTDPSTGPADPGDDPITFTSVPPIDPVFGSTYQVQASSASGKSVTFSVDGTPANACAINGDIVSFDHAGTCVITATVPARNAARSGGAGAGAGAGAGVAARPTTKVFSQTVVIPKGKQKIDFDLGKNAQVDGDQQLQASGGASGKDVTFTSDTPGVCSVNPAGTRVAFHHAQGCTVTAHQDGNEDYKPADDVSSTVNVDRGDQAIDFTSAAPDDAVVQGTSYQVSATGGRSGNPVKFSVDPDTSPACAVDGSTVSFAHAGTCVVTAHQNGDDDYRPADDTQTVLVGKGTQTLDFTTVPDGKVGASATLQATSSAGLDVTFSTESTSCSISGKTVTYDHARACVVTAFAGNADWKNATQDQIILVARGDQTIDFPQVTGAKVGTDTTLHATSSAGLDVTFTTDSTSCSVSGDTLTFEHARPCRVTATQAGNNDWNAAKDNAQTLDIAKGDQTIDFRPVTDGKVGTSSPLRATSSTGLDVTFSTDDASCTVLGSTVTFNHAFRCVVTATQPGDDDWNPTSVDQPIDIAKGDQTIDFTPVTGAKVGTASTLQATSSAGLPIAFSGTGETCTVTGSTVRFTHAGPCVVTASQAGNDDWNATSVDQTITVGKGAPHLTITVPSQAAVGGTGTATAASDSDGAITFSVGDATTNAACTVSPDGAVAYRHAGTCEVTADQAESTDFGAASTSGSLTVGKGEQKIAFQLPATANLGDRLPLTATGGDSGNPVSFTSSRPEACVVNQAGTEVRFAHAGTCTITAHQKGNADYDDAPDVTQTVTVAKADQKITFALPATGKVGDTLALTASGGASGNPVTYTSSAACTVNGAQLTLVHAGSCAVTAHQAGNDDYTAALDVTQTVTVAKADQRITFTLPATGKVGDTLALTATGGPSGNPVSYTIAPDSQKVCSISGSNLRLDHPGACRVAAHQKGNDDYNDAPEATQTVTVAKADQKITFTSTPPSPALVGSTYGVSATGGASGKSVTFGSATPNVCSVSGSTVTFLKAGTCSITADQLGNDDYNAAPQATQSFTVSAPARDLTMNITTRPGLLFGLFGTIVDVEVVGLDPGAHATLEMKAHHAIAFGPSTCDANGDNNHADCDVTSTPTTFSFLAVTLQHDANLQFEVRSKDSIDSNPNDNEKTVPLD